MDSCGSCPCDVVEIELIVEKELGDEEFCPGLDLFYGDFEVLFWGGAVDVFFGVAGAADAEAVVVGEVVDEVVGVGGSEERKGAWKLEKAPMPEIGQL